MAWVAAMLPSAATATTAAAAIPASVAAVPAAASIFTAYGGTTLASSSFWTLGNTLMVAGTALDALGSIGQGEAAAKAAEANAEIIRANAAYNEQVKRREGTARLASINAAYGKSGVTMEGTPILVLSEQAGQNELDALVERYMGQNEASAKIYQAQSSRTSGYSKAATSLLVGGAKIANKTGLGESLL